MKNEALLRTVLGSDNFIVINKPLAKSIGLEETYMFQHLLGLSVNCFGGKEFFQQQDRIAEELGLSLYKTKAVIKNLIELGFLTVTFKGVPAKNYYSFNSDAVMSKLNNLSVDNEPSSESKIDQLDS